MGIFGGAEMFGAWVRGHRKFGEVKGKGVKTRQ